MAWLKRFVLYVFQLDPMGKPEGKTQQNTHPGIEGLKKKKNGRSQKKIIAMQGS